MARIIKPPMFCDRLIEACRYEYKTRNLIDGRIVQCDQRISIVAGYLTEEIAGLSPFTFIHRDDVRWVMVALRQSEYLFGSIKRAWLCEREIYRAIDILNLCLIQLGLIVPEVLKLFDKEL